MICVSLSITQQLTDYVPIPDVADCKRLTALQCRNIYQYVMDHPDIYTWTCATRSHTEIDQSSVQHCTQAAFAESIQQLAENIVQAKCGSTTTTTTDLQFYSIVDGHRSPPPPTTATTTATGSNSSSTLQIRSRPWKHADATVYTVALASCVARTLHETVMQQQQYEILYQPYGFAQHGGYPTRAHIQALHKYGPCPIHRTTCKPVKDRMSKTTPTSATKPLSYQQQSPILPINRQSFVATVFGGTTLAFATAATIRSEPAKAMYVDSKTRISLPEPGEIEAAVPVDWSVMDNPVDDDTDSTPFARLDTTNDALFYQQPRFVEHVDETAVQSLTRYIQTTALVKSGSGIPVTAVLDLCASWTSHMVDPRPESSLQRVAGLGMNAQELAANTALTEWTVQDLNAKPVLPYADDSFDVVLCQLSIDYLTQPLAVCREIGRVLKPGGTVHIMFSNRLFLSKAVALWTGKDDIDHTFIVASYLHFCNGSFTNIQAKDLSTRKQGRVIGDPLYVVTGTKSAY